VTPTTATLTIMGSTAGTYNVLVTGTANSGTMVHTLGVTAVVQ
jgi:hypothetical protein